MNLKITRARMTICLTIRLSDADARRQMEMLDPNHRLPPWHTEDATPAIARTDCETYATAHRGRNSPRPFSHRNVPIIARARPPYIQAFRRGVISTLAELSGSSHGGHVMYTRFQYILDENMGLRECMNMSSNSPQNTGTTRPTAAQINPCT